MIYLELGPKLMMVRTLWKNKPRNCIKCELHAAFGTTGHGRSTVNGQSKDHKC